MQKNYFVTGRLNYLMAFKLQKKLGGGGRRGQATHGKKTFLSVLFS